MWVEKRNVIVEMTLNFSIAIVKFAEELEKRQKFVIANQILRSGTSIGANVTEAQNAESKKDFIHKMKIATKEASETKYWLLICEQSESYPFDQKLMDMVEQISKVLSRILTTTKKNILNADNDS